MSATVEFWVAGLPVTQGSKRVFINRKTGVPIITEDRSTDLKFWRGRIANEAQRAMAVDTQRLFVGDGAALAIDLWFTLPRPPSRAKRYLYPNRRPDFDKLTRAACDALKGIVYSDDGLICDAHVHKRYVGQEGGADAPGVQVAVSLLPGAFIMA